MSEDARPSGLHGADEIRHATTVALAGRGLMIVGPSGSGKSALALTLMAHGAELVADDRTRVCLSDHPARAMADAPPGLPALIEARGIGLLHAQPCGPVPLVAVADMGRKEPDRLPEPRSIVILGQKVALFHAAGNTHFAYAILQYLRAGLASGETHEQ
jgi:HPr kinase/phosphorylase